MYTLYCVCYTLHTIHHILHTAYYTTIIMCIYIYIYTMMKPPELRPRPQGTPAVSPRRSGRWGCTGPRRDSVGNRVGWYGIVHSI